MSVVSNETQDVSTYRIVEYVLFQINVFKFVIFNIFCENFLYVSGFSVEAAGLHTVPGPYYF
jgi:hypothetical protein